MDDKNPYTSSQTSSTQTSVPRPAYRPESLAARGQWASLVISAVGGALVWGTSPMITGEMEPWDAGSTYYGLGMAIASAMGAQFARRRIWLPIVGAYLGQVFYCLAFYHPGGPAIFPMWISAAVFGIVPSTIGSIAGAIFSELIRKSRRSNTAE